jgi:hypothetical protein
MLRIIDHDIKVVHHHTAADDSGHRRASSGRTVMARIGIDSILVSVVLHIIFS